MMTFRAPPWSMWTRALFASVNSPVDSTTMSTPRSRHGRSPGSRRERNLTVRPSTPISSPLAWTGGANVPRAVSCFSRCAKVPASPRSLTATTSMSWLSWYAARKMFRPMRPNPLIPTRTDMQHPPNGFARRAEAPGNRPHLVSARPVERLRQLSSGGGGHARLRVLLGLLGDLHQPAQPVVDRRLGEPQPDGQLGQVPFGVGAARLRDLAQRRRQLDQPAAALELLDGGHLPHRGADRLVDVRGLEVQSAVDLARDLAHYAHVLELHHGAGGAHQRQHADDAVAVLDVQELVARSLGHAGADPLVLQQLGEPGCPAGRRQHHLQVVAGAGRVHRAAAHEEAAQHRLAVARGLRARPSGGLGEVLLEGPRYRQLDEERHLLGALRGLVLGLESTQQPRQPDHLPRRGVAQQWKVGGPAVAAANETSARRVEDPEQLAQLTAGPRGSQSRELALDFCCE